MVTLIDFLEMVMEYMKRQMEFLVVIIILMTMQMEYLDIKTESI
jgi:hypothetical protein